MESCQKIQKQTFLQFPSICGLVTFTESAHSVVRSPSVGLFLWKIKLYLEIEILSCLFPDFFLMCQAKYTHTHVCVYIYICTHTIYVHIMSMSLKSVQTMAVHSLLLSDSLTLHSCHPQTRPYASVFVLFLSENQTFLCVIQQRRTGGREDK